MASEQDGRSPLFRHLPPQRKLMNKRNRLTTWILVGLVPGHRRRLRGEHPSDRSRRASPRHHVAGHRRVPAPDQDDHRAAGVLDPGRRHRAHGRRRPVGRIGVKALGWFVIASLVSLTLGLVLVNLLQPGRGDRSLPLPDGARVDRPEDRGVHAEDFVTAPRADSRSSTAWRATRSCRSSCSRCSSASRVAALGERTKPLLERHRRAGRSIMLKVTGYVMKFAPLAVFARVASTVATQGLGVLADLRQVHGRFYLGLVRAVGAC